MKRKREKQQRKITFKRCLFQVINETNIPLAKLVKNI